MIRQICPNCFHPVEVPDAAAGTSTPCPQCGKPFPVPAAYAPAVADAGPGAATVPPPDDRPPPPPGYVPGAARRTDPPPAGPAAPVAEAGGDGPRHAAGITLSPDWVGWVAPVALAGVVVLTFFSWVGTFPGGYRVFTQTPWQAVTGAVENQTLFDASHAEVDPLRADTPGNYLLMVPFFLCLLAAAGLTWADRLLSAPPTDRLPRSARWVGRAWPVRQVLAAGLAAAALLFAGLQAWQGFGLETAVRQRVAEDVTKATPPAGPGQGPRPPSPFLLGEKAGHYSLQATTARDAALALLALAVAGLLAQRWLARRGAAPAPRLTASW